MDDRYLARWRLRTQRLAWHRFPTVADAVDGLLAVQAENYAQASWAIAARTGCDSAAAIDAAIDDGTVLRTHVLRPTWHFVHRRDIRWLVALTGPRVRRSLTSLQHVLGVPDATLESATAVLADALRGHRHHTREEIGDVLADAGFPKSGQVLGLVLMWAEIHGSICSGPLRDGTHTYALLDERAPDAPTFSRDEAVDELVIRYFSGHGPATERDLAYWASMTLTDVRAGLNRCAGMLSSFHHDGRTYWHAELDDITLPRDVDPRAQVLQVLDEFHHGYQDSRHVLDAGGIVPRGRGSTMGMVLVDGQMVGGMRRTINATTVEFAVEPFTPIGRDEVAAVQDAAHRCAAFLDRQPLVLMDGEPLD